MNTSEEEKEYKKKYVGLFPNPETKVKQVDAAQQEDCQNGKIEDARKLQTLENLLETNSLPAHPFTFLTAVKRKLTLGSYPASKKAYDPDDKNVTQPHRNAKHKAAAVTKMSYIKPLKVPDLKISPKTSIDYSSRESCCSTHEDMPKNATKSADRVQRKLEFQHSGGCSILNSENIEPLVTPDISISSSLGKKKDHVREHSKEKENRSKKIKRDKSSDELLCKIKNLKHVSKKDELANKLKSEVSSQRRLKEKEDGKKLKPSKIFVTSTLKKEEDRRHPSTFKKDKREPARSLSNDSNSTSERSVKSTDKITLRDGYRSSVLSDEGKHKNCQKYEVKSLVKESVVVKKSADKLKQGSKVRDTTDGTESCSSELVHKKTDDSHVASSTSQDEVSKEKRSDQLLDPVRIDFRDGNGSPQAEFSQLDTPDISSFMRMKRRRQMLQQDEAINNRRTHENQTQMLHPTALHMQFQAELNLLDTFNESLRQVRDVENCLYNDKELISKGINIEETAKGHHEVDSVKPKSATVKVAQVQTQTANDMATQTDSSFRRRLVSKLDQSQEEDLSAASMDQSADLERLEDFSFTNKMRTMSEISLHETTSSIKTETGTEISISMRDITYSFNKYLDLEMAQLIKDEKQRYDKIQMLFKSREKTLMDKTKKIVKLEEQKRALRDAGQDSQISSVKKKQRALLLKLQQEKDEMNRLKALHKIASQERKLMLQKQRDMFNPEMSTKNILTKLKRSADAQSPRRLSGPMKGYDIRSNSSMSSLVDSDRSQMELPHKDCLQLFDKPSCCKFEDKMPSSSRSDIIKLKQLLEQNDDSKSSIVDSDNLVEELLLNIHQKSKSKSIDKDKKQQLTHCSEVKTSSKRKGSRSQKTKATSESTFSKVVQDEFTNRQNNKRSKIESSDEIVHELDFNSSQNSIRALIKHSRDVNERNCQLLRDIANEEEERPDEQQHMESSDLGNLSARSQVSTLTISRHSSADSERSFSRSVVIRANDPRLKNSNKLEQILNAREAALASRRSCVEEWIAWHARLREEENRVARMEEAALKLVSAASNAISYHQNDTTVSSDTSDVEGRIEQLTKKLADRRLEMARLKKEARRQVKQRLRALEANLLHQIKKYDSTIDEMRKKLETKKSCVKDSEKLAIEAKSVIDFKVPEIPIKRIQDIYKSSDLLRCKSEPTLIAIEQATESHRTPAVTTTDDDHSTAGSLSNNHHSSPRVTSEEEIFTNVDSGKTKLDDVLETENIVSENITSENHVSTENIITENVSSENVKTESGDLSAENVVDSSDSIPLQNKIINENMIILENDLKSLTEMMSDFSKKSHAKLKLVREARIFDELNSANSQKSTEISEKLSTDVPESRESRTSDLESVKSTDIEAQSKQILNEIEKSIISDKIKSLESQEPQTSQLTFEVGMQNLYKENEALSKDLNSLEADIESLSAMISKVIKTKSSSSSSCSSTEEKISEHLEVQTGTNSVSLIPEELQEEEEESVSKSGSELIETAVDTPREETLEKNESTTQISEQVSESEEEGLSRSSAIVQQIIEGSLTSLQDLKETDVDSPVEISEQNDAILGDADQVVEQDEIETIEKSSEEEEKVPELSFVSPIKSDVNWELSVEVQSEQQEEDSVNLEKSDEHNSLDDSPQAIGDATFIVNDDEDVEDESLPGKNNNQFCESVDETTFEGEQLDNLIQVAEDKLSTLEKEIHTSEALASEFSDPITTEELKSVSDSDKPKVVLKSDEKTDTIRDAEYSDISDESNEVNEIMVRSEPKKRHRLVVPLIENCEVETAEEKKSEEATDSNEAYDTPRGVAEIELDSPRKDQSQENCSSPVKKDVRKNDYHTPGLVSTSERNLELMIDKLKASLEQPGLEVAELEAKLLRIEQLQIELEIKKLEAEEVSYYVREIPNKPPPPYTPPGTGGALTTPTATSTSKTTAAQILTSTPPAVVPSNIEELTKFTEKATRIIFEAKQTGVDITDLEPPQELCEDDNTDVAKTDRRIYNSFLFDLCKEIIGNIDQSDCEKPGPSWTRPDVHTKTTIKRPKNVEQLHEYVNKEVALLFGFKTKLQRENMVMRWSRKRRDRVDELLAREAQAEEDEWTKFQHDELTVKNELTLAILDALIIETASVVKHAHASKQRFLL